MTISESILEGFAKDLRPGIKGASRAAIKTWLLSNKCITETTSNTAIKKAINKLMDDGMLIAVTNHRFKVNVAKQLADKKAKNAVIKKKKAVKIAKVKAVAAAKKAKAAKKKMISKKKAAAMKVAKKLKAKKSKKKKVVKKTKTKKTKKSEESRHQEESGQEIQEEGQEVIVFCINF
eukprot:554184_1